MPYEFPIEPDVPLFEFRCRLDGTDYVLRFDWNGRDGRFYLSLFDANRTLIVGGIRIVKNFPILRKYQYENMPLGLLQVSDLSQSSGQPELGTLGRRFRLFYWTVAELKAREAEGSVQFLLPREGSGKA